MEVCIQTSDALGWLLMLLKHPDHAVFHIRAQNAGILLTRRQNDIMFDSFELLAPDPQVTACMGRLLREFPDRAASVQRKLITQRPFLSCFAEVVGKLDSETVPVYIQPPEASSSGTSTPILVTGMIMDILVGLGQSVSPVRYTKKSREQVSCLNESSTFRRSPIWILARVALRLVLDRQASNVGLPSWYKAALAFHHSWLARKALDAKLSNSLLFCIGAKLARRMKKLDPEERTPWVQSAADVAAQLGSVLKTRWKKVQQASEINLPLDELANLYLSRDVNLPLQTLGPHLDWIKSRTLTHKNDTGPGDGMVFHKLSSTELPTLEKTRFADDAMETFRLLEFESWIDSHLSAWVECRTNAETDLAALGGLANTYYTRAHYMYSNVPEALSAMYLCLMELWVAVDRLASRITPLLLDYDPGFPPRLLHRLLLPTKCQMIRLGEFERYLRDRKTQTWGSYHNAFTGFGTRESFAVQYYREGGNARASKDKETSRI